ncbi:hypothetical protein [Streptomyces sp. NRRL S-87]|uniref:hypothetical protein n=1 Tax=Streptomyces sp. NRRL S-87 TaxID=1463920 RepID=UPI0004C16AC9|nr:hypothetical protein [Streptomyces sp. NRRL S-87]
MANNHMPEDDRGDATLVREEMERLIAELPPVEDVVPAAVAQGRRRRTRARVAVAAGVATAAVLGVVALPLGQGGATTVRPAASTEPPRPSLAPRWDPSSVPVRPTGGGGPSASPWPSTDEEIRREVSRLPPQQQRREEFRLWSTAALNELMPRLLGPIRPVDADKGRYQAEAPDGNVFPVVLSVRPSGGAPDVPRPCPVPPRVTAAACERIVSDTGIEMTSWRINSGGPNLVGFRASFTYEKASVSLTVLPDTKARVSAPVNHERLLRTASDPLFLHLVRKTVER